jgi:hypothetical protein
MNKEYEDRRDIRNHFRLGSTVARPTDHDWVICATGNP